VIDLVGIEPAQVLGQAFLGPLRANGIRASGLAVRVSVAVTPSCGRLSVTVSLGRTSSTFNSPTARCTGPSIRVASQPARTSSAGSPLSPDTSAELIGSHGGWSMAEASSARQYVIRLHARSVSPAV
jgi:hypothetical protein